MARKKLGEILLERGLIDATQLNEALSYQRKWGHRLGVALVTKGFITEVTLVKVLSEVMSLPAVDLTKVEFDPNALDLISAELCENYDLIPIVLEEKRGSKILTIAMADPMNVAVIDEIEFTVGCKVRPVLSTLSAITGAVRRYYRGRDAPIHSFSNQAQVLTIEGEMELVRPGGKVEKVNTATYREAHASGFSKTQPETPPALPPKTQTKTDIKQQAVQEYMSQVPNQDSETLQKLEKYFWALMRIMAKKGYVTKEEFLQELKE